MHKIPKKLSNLAISFAKQYYKKMSDGKSKMNAKTNARDILQTYLQNTTYYLEETTDPGVETFNIGETIFIGYPKFDFTAALSAVDAINTLGFTKSDGCTKSVGLQGNFTSEQAESLMRQLTHGNRNLRVQIFGYGSHFSLAVYLPPSLC